MKGFYVVVAGSYVNKDALSQYEAEELAMECKGCGLANVSIVFN